MIGKQLKGRDFSGCVAYVMSKPGAKVLKNSTQGQDSSSIAADFDDWCAVNHRVQRKVYHAILSAPVEERERLTPELWNQIAQDYLEKMGFTGVPCLVVEHNNTEHPHIHIIAPRVGVNGKCISDSWDYYRSEKALRGLESKYELSSPPPSRLMRRGQPVHEIASNKPVSPYAQFRQRVTAVVDQAIANSKTLAELQELCLKQGLEVKLLTYTAKNAKKTPSNFNPLENAVKVEIPTLGIGLAYVTPRRKYAIAGSSLGSSYSLKSICDRLEREEETQEQAPATAPRIGSQWLSKSKIRKLYTLAEQEAQGKEVEVGIFKVRRQYQLEPDVARQIYKLTPAYREFKTHSLKAIAQEYLDVWSYGQKTPSEYRKVIERVKRSEPEKVGCCMAELLHGLSQIAYQYQLVEREQLVNLQKSSRQTAQKDYIKMILDER